MRIIEYKGGPADGKLEAVSNNNCAEILYYNRAALGIVEWDAYLYKFDGFANNGYLYFKFVEKVGSDYKYLVGFGPSNVSDCSVATPLRIEC